MLIFIFILLLLFIILFISIPIKFKVVVNLDEVKVYLFNKELKSHRSNEDKKSSNSSNFSFIKISTLKYKPDVHLNFNLEYGFDDAAYTGMFFGIFSALLPIIHRTLDSYIKISKYKYYINPNFDKKIFNLIIDGIIKLNLVKAIYIFAVVKNNKHWLRRKYYGKSSYW